MGVLAELFDDVKFIFSYRKRVMKLQEKLNVQAPKVGDQAPDFTLTDSSGADIVTLSDYRGKKPVALVFGSFT